MIDGLLASTGLLATVWIVVGILFAGSKYEGYSHSKQFCSELGALGSPTQKLSPLINNYPLAILFCIFGSFLIMQVTQSAYLMPMGILIIFHGVSTLVTGYFPMDKDPYTQHPSIECKIHSAAGFVMFLTLTAAPAVVLFSPDFTVSFKWFSVACLSVSIYFMATLAKAYKNKTNPGTHQRLSYGAQLIWLAGLSIQMVYES